MRTFLVNLGLIFVLFDSGASHSFIAMSCASKVGLSSPVSISIEFAQPSGDRVTCVKAYRDVSLDFLGVPLLIHLIEFPLDNFDVILGMN